MICVFILWIQIFNLISARTCFPQNTYTQQYGDCSVNIDTCGHIYECQYYWCASAENNLGDHESGKSESNEHLSETGAIEEAVRVLFAKITSCNCDIFEVENNDCTLQITVCFNFDNGKHDVSNNKPQYKAWAKLKSNTTIFGQYCCNYDKSVAIDNAIREFNEQHTCPQTFDFDTTIDTISTIPNNTPSDTVIAPSNTTIAPSYTTIDIISNVPSDTTMDIIPTISNYDISATQSQSTVNNGTQTSSSPLHIITTISNYLRYPLNSSLKCITFFIIIVVLCICGGFCVWSTICKFLKNKRQERIITQADHTISLLTLIKQTELLNENKQQQFCEFCENMYKYETPKIIEALNQHHQQLLRRCELNQEYPFVIAERTAFDNDDSYGVEYKAGREVFNTIHKNNATINIGENKKYNQLTDTKNTLDFGCEFRYDDTEQKHTSAIIVHLKFDNLKQELLQNPYVQLTAEQYYVQYKKTEWYLETVWMRELYNNIPLQCVLAMMIYCNFDTFQYHFSRTYRKHMRKEHGTFFHFGKALKQAVQAFGTTIVDGNVKEFYHGVSEELVPSEIVGVYGEGISIYCPLSTSSCWSAAVNFSQGNNSGLIMTLGGDSSEAKYFPVFMISNYPSEREYLFLQNKHKLQLVDIQLSTKESFRETIDALKYFDAAMDQTNYGSQHPTQSVVEIIDHRLKNTVKCTEDKPHMHRNYKQRLIDVYLQKKTKLTINYQILRKKYEGLFDAFCMTKCEWINVSNLMDIFPHIEEITIKTIHLRDEVMNAIPDVFDRRNNNSWNLKTMIIKAHKSSKLKVYDAVEQYRKAYQENNLRLHLEGNYKQTSHDILIINY